MLSRINKIRWSYLWSDDADLSLGPKDVDHLKQVYQRFGVEPETVSNITVEFLLQRETQARFIVKQCDVLLRNGGSLEVVIVNSRSHSDYFRSNDQVMHEVAIATNGRYRLSERQLSSNGKLLTLRYEKVKPTSVVGDKVSRWSFGIISDGRKNDLVTRLVHSIYKQQIPDFEIIICGPYEPPEDINTEHIVFLDDIELHGDIRPPTPQKKNKIISQAKFNNLCIMHDRIFLPESWFANFIKYGNYFDILCLPTRDLAHRRFDVDWMEFCNPVGERLRYNGSLKYERWSHNVIVQGGIIIAKKHLIDHFKLDERLHWGELEDMQFSKEAYLKGLLINVDPNNFVYSTAVNHEPKQASQIEFFIKFYYRLRRPLAAGVKFWLTIIRYRFERKKTSN